MKEIKILFTTRRPKPEIDYLKRHLVGPYKLIFPNTYTEEGILEHIEDVDILLGDFVTREMLERGDIKLVQVPFAGIENLDSELLSNYDVPVCNSHSNALAVAESAVALLLSIAKKIPYHDKLLRNGDWNKTTSEDTSESLSIYGSYLYNKRVGFIGYGNIGRRISKLLSGFDCKYMAIVRDKNKHYEELDFIGDRNDLDYVLSNADYLIIAAPLTEGTEGMLNLNNLKKLKRTAYIINISRGRIIDEESLYYILSNNLIRGAAIDVWYNYPEDDELTRPSKFDFHKLNNIIMSPHRADLIYGHYPYWDDAIKNIKALREGKDLINLLDLRKGY